MGFASQAIFLIIVGFTTSKTLAIAGLTLAVGLGGLTWSGFPCNVLDIAPRYAGILMGLSNCVATIPGIVSPLLTGVLTRRQTQQEWMSVFLIAAGCYAVGLFVYVGLASGEKQQWADHTGAEEEEEEEVVAPLISAGDKE